MSLFDADGSTDESKSQNVNFPLPHLTLACYGVIYPWPLLLEPLCFVVLGSWWAAFPISNCITGVHWGFIRAFRHAVLKDILQPVMSIFFIFSRSMADCILEARCSSVLYHSIMGLWMTPLILFGFCICCSLRKRLL